MEHTKQVGVYDPEIGAKVLTVADAAKYLGYGEFSVRRLICKKKLNPYGKVGNKWMFLRDELDRFKSTNPWAARKADIQSVKELPPQPPKGLKAEVRLDLTFGSMLTVPLETIENFTWEQIPLIRARIHHTHGDVAFEINIQGPDGASWSIDYQPPTWFEKTWKRLKGK